MPNQFDSVLSLIIDDISKMVSSAHVQFINIWQFKHIASKHKDSWQSQIKKLLIDFQLVYIQSNLYTILGHNNEESHSTTCSTWSNTVLFGSVCNFYVTPKR